MPQIIEYLLCLIDTGIVFSFFNLLIERRFKSKLSILPVILINSTISFFCTNLELSLRAIILVTITIIGCCIVYKGALYVKTALSIAVLFLLNIIDIVFGLFTSLILKEQVYNVFFESTIRRVILCLIIKAVDALAVFVVYKMLSKHKFEISGKVWCMFCSVMSTYLLVTIIFAELYQNSSENPSVSTLYFIASIAFFITGMITIYFFSYICGSFNNEKHLYVLQKNYDGIKEQLFVQSENSKKINKIRHDTKNHLQNVKILLTQCQYKEAESLVYEMIEQADNIHIEFNAVTRNDIIDAAIAVKSAICKSLGIEFKLFCETLPNLSISEIDLSSLISNILDNAVTAAEKTDSPRIILRIFVHGEYLNILSENTCGNAIKKRDEGKITALLTTKCGEQGEHGFGTQIIGEIAQKYDGVCVYKYENGFFKMNVMLNYRRKSI